MKIQGQFGLWWLHDNSFVCNRENATDVATMNECKEIIRQLLEIPSLNPDEITIWTNGGATIRADKFFRKVQRWTLLDELPKINLGGKCKNLAEAKKRLDNYESICVNGCEIWNSGRCYCWKSYGSSANKRTLDGLRFIFGTIAKSEDFAFSVIPEDLGVFEIREIESDEADLFEGYEIACEQVCNEYPAVAIAMGIA